MSTNETCLLNTCFVKPAQEHYALGAKALNEYERASGVDFGSFSVESLYKNASDGTYYMTLNPSANGRFSVSVQWNVDANGKFVNAKWSGHQDVTRMIEVRQESEGSVWGAVGGVGLIIGGGAISASTWGLATPVGGTMVVGGAGLFVASCGGSGIARARVEDAETEFNGEIVEEDTQKTDTVDTKPQEITPDTVEETTPETTAEVTVPEVTPETVEDTVTHVDTTPETTVEDTFELSDTTVVPDTTGDVTPGEISEETSDIFTGELSDTAETTSDVALETSETEGDVAVDGEPSDEYAVDVTPLQLEGIYLCYQSSDCGKAPNYQCIAIDGLKLLDGTVEDVSDYSAFVNPNSDDVMVFSSPNLGDITFTKVGEPDGVSGEWYWEAVGGLLTGAMNIFYMPEYQIFDLNFYSDGTSVDYTYCKHYYQNCALDACQL